MYLLFLDESGTHGGSPVFILSGLAIHEQDAWYLQREFHRLLARQLPSGMNPLDFELHASEMIAPNRARRKRPTRPSAWLRISLSDRLSIMDEAYKRLLSYACRDPAYPCALFGAVVDRSYADREQRAYEEVLHKFDEMLTRQGNEQGGPHQRGLVIHDKRVVERDVQAWTAKWRHVAGRIGVLTHLAEVPVFADSRASRLIQGADLISWALWRYYGLPSADEKWVKPIWGMFDSDAGTMHGLIHVTRLFKTGACGCPPCASRQAAQTP